MTKVDYNYYYTVIWSRVLSPGVQFLHITSIWKVTNFIDEITISN